MPQITLIQRLPDEYLILIGEVTTLWAIQEFDLKATLYLILGVGEKRGRVATRSPRSSEIVDMIGELSAIIGLPTNPKDMKSFAHALDELERRRNIITHNIIVEHEGNYHVQHLTGVYTPKGKGKAKTTRRVDPEFLPIDLAFLRELVAGIQNTIRNTRKLRGEIAERLAALPKTHREQVDPTTCLPMHEFPTPLLPPSQK